jgi:hypothetical protein
MSNLKPTSVKINLGGEEYGLRFTLNAIDDIQDYFDIPISKMYDLMKDERKAFKSIKAILVILINENIDCENENRTEKLPHVDARYIGRRMEVGNIAELSEAIANAFTGSAPLPDNEDDAPNVESEQQKN